MSGRWRVVGVLDATSAQHADSTTDAVRAAMADLGVRVYASGRHLVVVTSVPGADGKVAQAAFERRLGRLVGAPVVVADVWHGRRPLAHSGERAA